MKSENTIVSSMFWKFMERGAAQLFSMVVQIVLARLLAPEDFGTLAILLVFVNISNVLIQKGFATSLVQKAKVSDIELNTTLAFSEAVALLLYVILWIAGPAIEHFYKTDNLTLYIRIISVTLFSGAFYSIENAVMIRKMRFKQMFYSSFLATIIGGATGVACACAGLGCGALIAQNVVQQVLLVLFSYPFSKWKIRREFDKEVFKNVFGFGSNVLISELMYTGVENIRTLLIGARYSSTDLAYYDRGQTYPSVAMRSIYDTLGSVLLPIFSKDQSNKEELKRKVYYALGTSLYLIAPVFVGLALVADSFTVVFLSEKWLPSVPYLRVFCIYQLGILPYCILRNVIYSLGKGKESLLLETVKSVTTLLAIIVGIYIGPFSIAILSTIAVWASVVLYLACAEHFVHFGSFSLIQEIARVILYCAGMAAVVAIVNNIVLQPILCLVASILSGAVTYLVLSILCKDPFFRILCNRLKQRRNEHNV